MKFEKFRILLIPARRTTSSKKYVMLMQRRTEYGSYINDTYSHALLSNSISHREMLAYPLAFGEVGIKERIKSVMKYKKPASWLMGMAVVSCIVVAACFLTNPKKTKLQGATEGVVTEQSQENNKEQEKQTKDTNEFALNPTVNLSASLGADGARLNYADGERIILSCSPYLMVYSKTDKKCFGYWI